MEETRGAWKTHPSFKEMKDAAEIVEWLKQKKQKHNRRSIKK